MVTFDKFLSLHAVTYPEKCALVFKEKRWLYRDLNARANRLANGLLDLGAKKGDRVGVLLHNGNEIAEAVFASARIGTVSISLNFRLAGREFEYILDNSDATILIYGQEFQDKVDAIRSNLKKIKHYIRVGENEIKGGDYQYEQLLQTHSDSEPSRQIEMDDDSSLIYTSGTTGRPKGVVRTHQTNLWASLNTVIEMGYRFDDVEMYMVPLFNVGFFNFFTPNIIAGGTVVVISQFEENEVLRLIETEQVTRMFMVPAMWNRLINVKNFFEYDLSSLRVGISGAESMPTSLKHQIKERFTDIEIWECYGLSEGGKTYLRPDDCLRKFSSVGKAGLTDETRVVDENDEDVGIEKEGEVLFRGPSLMKEYYGNSEATAQALKGGWLHTGDIGKLDEDGFLYIVDRKKDMIISGGENIYPREIEDVLASHPKIFEVAVIGLPDPQWGESVMAVVVVKEGETMEAQEVVEYCKSSLASYKKPRAVEFVDSLPRNPSGKVLKPELREKYGKS